MAGSTTSCCASPATAGPTGAGERSGTKSATHCSLRRASTTWTCWPSWRAAPVRPSTPRRGTPVGATTRAHHRRWSPGREGSGKRLPLLQGSRWGHLLLIEQFLDWLDGGDPMETNVQDNLRSVALTFAAVRSSRTGAPVEVAGFLARTLDEVQLDQVGGHEPP